MKIRNELINEICAENNITVDYLCQDWILRFTKDGKQQHIYGPYWPLNSAAADRLACDKAGCYTMLNLSGIPAIEHIIMYNPLKRAYLLDENGTITNALAYFEANNRKIVLKPNKGTQGQDVFFCDTPLALESAMQTIFALEPDMAVCPYHEISTEYRVFYLHGRACYVYGKTKGDDWKHNLSQGAKAFEVDDGNLRAKLAELAVKAAQCININFATVDISALENGEHAIMEINAGIQAQILLEQLPHRREKIKGIYADAITSMFA